MDDLQKKSKLNILIVYNSIMGVVGGGSRHIIEVADYWCINNNIDYLISQAGWDVAKPYINKKENPNKNVILYSNLFDRSKKRFLVYSSRIIFNIRMRFKLKRKYNIIIAPNYLPQNIIPAIFFKKMAKSKLVVYFHTTPPFVRKAYLNKLNLFHRCISLLNWHLCVFISKYFFDIIFVVNKVTKEYFIEKGISQNKIFITNNGVDLDLINNIKNNNKEFDACFLGRLVENKGVFDLIEIWKIITSRHPHSKLCIIGDGPEKNKLSEIIKNENLTLNIFLVGQKEAMEKYELMKKSKFFIYPSYYEAQPTVVFEALACNLIVLAYDLPSYDEFFKGNILKTKLYNVNHFANQYLTLIENQKDYNSIKEKSVKMSSIKNWKDIAEDQLSIMVNKLGDD